jgi:hypothetical protein
MCGIVGVLSVPGDGVTPSAFDGWRDRLAHRPRSGATF